MFDHVFAIDWSARSRPSPKKPSPDSIFIAQKDAGNAEYHPKYFRTRLSAYDYLKVELKNNLTQGKRQLVGFDFAFGFPTGFLSNLVGGNDVRLLWKWLFERIEDDDENSNNRFLVADKLNSLCNGIGPFWGCPVNLKLPNLPFKGTDCKDYNFPQFRLCELFTAAQSVWKLYTTGAVGSQTLLGLPYLYQLASEFGEEIAFWPFDDDAFLGNKKIVVCEIYPSMFFDRNAQGRLIEVYPEQQYNINDATQVHLMVEVLLNAFEYPWFRSYLIPNNYSKQICEEGWIFGQRIESGG
jgi:hypothetical protein